MILEKGQNPIYVFTCNMCNESTVERFDSTLMDVEHEPMLLDYKKYTVCITSVSKKCDNCGFEVVYGINLKSYGTMETRKDILNKFELHEETNSVYTEEAVKRYAEKYAFGSRLNKEDLL